MRRVDLALTYRSHPAALDAALRAALPGQVIGLRAYDQSQPVYVYLDDATGPTEDGSVQATGSAHDPVFLSVDRTAIIAANPPSDLATVTARAPNPNAAAITLQWSGDGGLTWTDWPMPALSAGLTADTFGALDPGAYLIRVKNADNRSTDQLTITAR